MAKRKTKRKYCPGNFLPKTEEASKKFLKKWERVKDANGQPVITVAQLRVGVGGLKTKDVNITKTKFKQALDGIRYMSGKRAKFDVKLAKFKENMQQWKDCKARGVDLEGCGLSKDMIRRPGKPVSKIVADKGCAGNYKTPTKHGAVRYLKHFFRQLRPNMKDFVPDDAGVFTVMNRRGVGPRGSQANFIPRVRQAIEVVGVAETANIAQNAVSDAMVDALKKLDSIEAKLGKNAESLTKAEAGQAKKVEAAKKRLLTRKDKLEKDKKKLNKYLATVAMRRRKNRKLRRR